MLTVRWRRGIAAAKAGSVCFSVFVSGFTMSCILPCSSIRFSVVWDDNEEADFGMGHLSENSGVLWHDFPVPSLYTRGGFHSLLPLVLLDTKLSEPSRG